MIFTVTYFPPTEDFAEWVAGVVELEGVCGYGATRDDAKAEAQADALRALARAIEAGERPPLEMYESVMFLNDWSQEVPQ